MQRSDFDALVASLRAHPEWRDELRREVLTEELLGLPAALAELAQAQARTEARVEELAQAQARTEAQLQELAALVGELIHKVSRMDGQLAWVRGAMLELRHRDRAYTYFQRIARRVRVLGPEALDEILDEAVERGLFTEDEADEIRLSDVVARGRQEGEPVYIVVESSWGVGISDVHRAHRRADLLARTGVRTIAVVAGDWISPDVASAASGMGVWQVTARDGTVPAAA